MDEELELENQQSQDDELPEEDLPDEPQAGDDEQPDEGGNDDGDEDVVHIGDEAAPASEESEAGSKVFADLRRRYRELAQENAKLKAGKQATTATQPPVLPAKPTLASCAYDEDKFQADTDAWHAKKREVEAFEADQSAALQAQQKRLKKLEDDYTASRESLKVSDFDDAAEVVEGAFTEWQQGIAKAGPSHPGALIYALGKNPKKLAELASIKDPVKFAVAVGKLETEVKVTKRTSTNKPAPESTVRGGSGSAPATSATLERLEAAAAKTGDRSKVIAYKRQLKASGK